MTTDQITQKARDDAAFKEQQAENDKHFQEQQAADAKFHADQVAQQAAHDLQVQQQAQAAQNQAGNNKADNSIINGTFGLLGAVAGADMAAAAYERRDVTARFAGFESLGALSGQSGAAARLLTAANIPTFPAASAAPAPAQTQVYAPGQKGVPS